MDTYFFFVESASSFVGKEFTHFFLSSPHAFVFGLRKVTLTQLSVAGMALLQASPQGSPVLPVGKTELASTLLTVLRENTATQSCGSVSAAAGLLVRVQ